MLQEIENLIKDFDGKVSIYACDEKHHEIAIHETDMVETASCIKVGILIEYYRQLKEGIKSRDDILTYDDEKYYVEDGSGIIQFLEKGLQLTSKNMAILMIIVSDNIATNMMIDYLKKDNINQTLQALGLKHTKLIADILDFDIYPQIGTTTAKEYATIFKMLRNEEILTPPLCQEIIEILKTQTKNELLIHQLPLNDLDTIGKQDAILSYIASKSGGLGDKTRKIPNCRNDGGIISTKYGNYIVSIFIHHFKDEHWHIHNEGMQIGTKISSILYHNFINNKGGFMDTLKK